MLAQKDPTPPSLYLKDLRHDTGKTELDHIRFQLWQQLVCILHKRMFAEIHVQCIERQTEVFESKGPKLKVGQVIPNVTQFEVKEAVAFPRHGEAGTGADDQLVAATDIEGRGEVDANRNTTARGHWVDVSAHKRFVVGFDLIILTPEGDDTMDFAVPPGHAGKTVGVQATTSDHILGVDVHDRPVHDGFAA